MIVFINFFVIVSIASSERKYILFVHTKYEWNDEAPFSCKKSMHTPGWRS